MHKRRGTVSCPCFAEDGPGQKVEQDGRAQYRPRCPERASGCRACTALMRQHERQLREQCRTRLRALSPFRSLAHRIRLSLQLQARTASSIKQVSSFSWFMGRTADRDDSGAHRQCSPSTWWTDRRCQWIGLDEQDRASPAHRLDSRLSVASTCRRGPNRTTMQSQVCTTTKEDNSKPGIVPICYLCVLSTTRAGPRRSKRHEPSPSTSSASKASASASSSSILSRQLSQWSSLSPPPWLDTSETWR
jgi:hypothetical protein